MTQQITKTYDKIQDFIRKAENTSQLSQALDWINYFKKKHAVELSSTNLEKKLLEQLINKTDHLKKWRKI